MSRKVKVEIHPANGIGESLRQSVTLFCEIKEDDSFLEFKSRLIEAIKYWEDVRVTPENPELIMENAFLMAHSCFEDAVNCASYGREKLTYGKWNKELNTIAFNARRLAKAGIEHIEDGLSMVKDVKKDERTAQ